MQNTGGRGSNSAPAFFVYPSLLGGKRVNLVPLLCSTGLPGDQNIIQFKFRDLKLQQDWWLRPSVFAEAPRAPLPESFGQNVIG